MYHRKSLRLRGYSYKSNGVYYVTICTQDKSEVLCLIKYDKVILNEFSKIVQAEWIKTGEMRSNVILDKCYLLQGFNCDSRVLTRNGAKVTHIQGKANRRQ